MSTSISVVGYRILWVDIESFCLRGYIILKILNVQNNERYWKLQEKSSAHIQKQAMWITADFSNADFEWEEGLGWWYYKF